MNFATSLLGAIARADGDALVMHVGEKPYVIAGVTRVELSALPLTGEFLTGVLDQLLPAGARQQLSEFGAAEHELTGDLPPGGDRYVVVAAKGAGDVWIEIRRRRVAARRAAPATVAAASPLAASVIQAAAVAPPAAAGSPVLARVGESTPYQAAQAAAMAAPAVPAAARAAAPASPPPRAPGRPNDRAPAKPVTAQGDTIRIVAAPPANALRRGPRAVLRIAPRSPVRGPGAAAAPIAAPVPAPAAPAPHTSSIRRLLARAAALRASAVYLVANARPFARQTSGFTVLPDEPLLSSADIEGAVRELVPGVDTEALHRGDPMEWVLDLPDAGRVRCVTFRDRRGLGVIFHLVPARPISAEQLGLSSEIQSLAAESSGLVVVAAPRGCGKSTLIAALVDLINTHRAAHVITIERQIQIVHDDRRSFVSQREVSGTPEDTLAAMRAALREKPDVLVIEDVYSGDVFQLALEAAGTGLLVLLSVAAGSKTAAIDRLLSLVTPERRHAAQAAVAERLRGIVVRNSIDDEARGVRGIWTIDR